MTVSVLDQMTQAQRYDIVFVAPHLDDIALSCGGLVAAQTAAGRHILVVTICAGSPPGDQPLTPKAASLHQAWGLGDDPMERRRSEDRHALALLGADGLHLPLLDAVYREPEYGIEGAIFGPMLQHDPLVEETATILRMLRAQNPAAGILLPLAVGNHVDHQAVWAARGALNRSQVGFYEDFPYARHPGAVKRRLAMIDEPLVPRTSRIGDLLARKIAAVAEYRSQMSELFPEIDMAEAVTAYAAAVDGQGSYSERLWFPEA